MGQQTTVALYLVSAMLFYVKNKTILQEQTKIYVHKVKCTGEKLTLYFFYPPQHSVLPSIGA